MAGARTGFFLGFVGGAIISSHLARQGKNLQDIEAAAVGEMSSAAKSLQQKLTERIREAMMAGRQAAAEKQDEMLRDFERSKAKKA
jgi:hypothetical protein